MNFNFQSGIPQILPCQYVINVKNCSQRVLYSVFHATSSLPFTFMSLFYEGSLSFILYLFFSALFLTSKSSLCVPFIASCFCLTDALCFLSLSQDARCDSVFSFGGGPPFCISIPSPSLLVAFFCLRKDRPI